MRAFLADRFPYPWRIVIAENGSTDGTIEVAEALAARHEDTSCVLLGQRGRGRALRVAWTRSKADIVAYTDVDISTELEALEKLCRAIHEEGYDVAVGSRLSPESRVKRGLKREFISRTYNLFIKAVLFTGFVDAQCGFKAVSRRVVNEIVPEVKDQGWFFDTELLVLAEKRGFRIKDVPVQWVDDEDSRVRIVSTAWEDIKGVLRLRRYLWSPGFRRFVPGPSEERPA
jgi:glycosyltransferase involved in cell wall biosynthesis